jgi:hypothetical protein
MKHLYCIQVMIPSRKMQRRSPCLVGSIHLSTVEDEHLDGRLKPAYHGVMERGEPRLPR